MSSLQKKRIGVLPVLILLFCVLVNPFQSSVSAASNNSEVLGFVHIPSIDQLITGVEESWKRVAPDKFRPGNMRMTLGFALKDPGLTMVDTAKPAMALVLSPVSTKKRPSTKPDGAIFLYSKNPEKYVENLKKFKFAHFRKDNLFVISQKPASVERAKKFIAVFEDAIDDRRKDQIYLSIDIKSCMKAYGTQINSLVTFMNASMNTTPKPGAAKLSKKEKMQKEKLIVMVKAYAYGILELLKQANTMDASANFGTKDIVLKTGLSGKKGTALYKVLSAGRTSDKGFYKNLPKGGFYAGTYYYDTGAVVGFFESLIKSIENKDPALKGLSKGKIPTLISNMKKWWTGDVAFSMGMDRKGKMLFNYIYGVTDKDEAMKQMDASVSLIKEYAKLFTDKGKSPKIVLKKKVRKYKGVSIHRFTIDVDLKKLKGKDAEMVKKVLGKKVVYEFAFINGYSVGSVSRKNLHRMINSLKKGKGSRKLLAVQQFGKGSHMYVDYDIWGLFDQMGPLLSGALSPKEAKKFKRTLAKIKKTGRVVTVKGKYEDGAGTNTIRVPLEAIAALVKIGNEKKASARVKARRKR